MALSANGAIWGSISTTVTSAPSRRHTLPSSRPTAPAPTTTRWSGTRVSSSASVESSTTWRSRGRNGRSTGRLPVARITARVDSSERPSPW